MLESGQTVFVIARRSRRVWTENSKVSARRPHNRRWRKAARMIGGDLNRTELSERGDPSAGFSQFETTVGAAQSRQQMSEMLQRNWQELVTDWKVYGLIAV